MLGRSFPGLLGQGDGKAAAESCMFINYNPYSFLTGDESFLPIVPREISTTTFSGEVGFHSHHEGFIGIPHGGLPMGLCLDAWRQVGVPHYPVDVRFKFGGSGISIGDAAEFTVDWHREERPPHVVACITKNGDRKPYLRAEISPASGLVDLDVLPQVPKSEHRPLPYYRNCFVCGHQRTVTGLERQFRFHPGENGDMVVTAGWGFDSADADRATAFLIGPEELHPAVLISIFDENTAWGGFMQTGSAGLSVRLEFTLLRPVRMREKLLFVGRPAGIRGNPRSPRFFMAEGAIISMDDGGRPEPVAYGRGEWIVMASYTEQIKHNLLPEDDWSWIFRGSGAPER